MEKYKIPEFEKLEFIDEFPRATIPLKYNQFDSYNELIDYFVVQTGEYENSDNR
jgi:hypothetical protein